MAPGLWTHPELCSPGFGSRCFKPFAIGPSVAVGIRQGLWADAIYIRDFMKLNALSSEKLEKYAIVANDLLKSPDLSHLVLTELDARRGSDLAREYRNMFKSLNG